MGTDLIYPLNLRGYIFAYRETIVKFVIVISIMYYDISERRIDVTGMC